MSKTKKNYKKFRKAAEKLYGNGGIFYPDEYGSYYPYNPSNGIENLVSTAIRANNGDYRPDYKQNRFDVPVPMFDPKVVDDEPNIVYPYGYADPSTPMKQPDMRRFRLGYLNHSSNYEPKIYTTLGESNIMEKMNTMQFRSDIGYIKNYDPTNDENHEPVNVTNIVERTGSDLYCRVPDSIDINGYRYEDFNINGYEIGQTQVIENILAYGLIHDTGIKIGIIDHDKYDLFLSSLGYIYRLSIFRNKNLLSKLDDIGIIFVQASEFRVWTRVISSIYWKPNRDSFLSGAYYFPSDRSCYHYVGYPNKLSVTPPSVQVPVFKVSNPCDPLSKGRYTTFDESMNIQPDELIMIVEVPGMERVEAIIDFANELVRNELPKESNDSATEGSTPV